MHESLSQWKCAMLLKTMYLGQSVLAVLWEAEGRHPKARALRGAHKHNQWGFWLRCSASAYLNELKRRYKLGQCGDFDHPSQSPVSGARGCWSWGDKGQQDRYTWKNRGGPVGVRDQSKPVLSGRVTINSDWQEEELFTSSFWGLFFYPSSFCKESMLLFLFSLCMSSARGI